MVRPTPFDLVFSGLAPERFPPLRDALATAAIDPRDRDAFLLTQPAMAMLRELRPDDADAGSGIAELAALLHHAYLHWAAGCPTWSLPTEPFRAILRHSSATTLIPSTAGYLQLPERLVWATLAPPGPWEPLDGCFVHSGKDGHLHLLGVFGMHPGRAGFTVAEAHSRPGAMQARRDGTLLFAPSLEGGDLAGLHAVVEPEELVELAARVLADPACTAMQEEGA